MTKTEIKDTAKDEVLHSAKKALYVVYEGEYAHLTEEERMALIEQMKNQIERIAKFLGYEDVGRFI